MVATLYALWHIDKTQICLFIFSRNLIISIYAQNFEFLRVLIIPFQLFYTRPITLNTERFFVQPIWYH